MSAPGTAPAYTPYSTAPFQISTNSYAFGQAPVFMPDGRVVFSKDFGKGDKAQTYIANEDGSGLKCLTCELKGPNQVPSVRPQGDWILFHSWIGHSITLGAPGYGGIGSELYVMRPDGSHPTKIYELDAAHGAGEVEDAYHAYWSPDGKRLVWSHFNGNFVDNGGDASWDVRVADFVVEGGTPRLVNVRVVRKDPAAWYETQWWAPDGSGFLYTEGYQNTTNTELFYCRLTSSGCTSTRLTHNIGWDEQALFTPDMKDVIFMSSRDHPGFYNTFEQAALDANLPTSLDNFAILPIFELGFLQPLAGESTDLYDLNLATNSVRRLTTDGDDGWITPEFTWDPANKRLVWTENRITPGASVPLPLDLAKQIENTVAYLQHPDVNTTSLLGGNVLSATVPLQQRTRVATFAGACAPPARLTLRLPRAPRARLVRARVSVDGHSVLSRHGHALTKATIPNPRTENFTVRITVILSNGRRLSKSYNYSGMGCYRQ